jgi:hypothetical protein
MRAGLGGGGLPAVFAALAMLLYALELLIIVWDGGRVYTTRRPQRLGFFSFPLAGLRQRAGWYFCWPAFWVRGVVGDLVYCMGRGGGGREAERRVGVPGKQVKNWAQYEALRRQGYSKESAARIANSSSSRKRKGKKGRRTTDR